MNREDIIRMAREAGFHAWYTQPEEHPEHVAIIERFFQAAYAAGAAAERAEMAKHCAEITRAAVNKAVDGAIALEREAAEERVTDLFADMETPYLPDIVAAIRARGETK